MNWKAVFLVAALALALSGITLAQDKNVPDPGIPDTIKVTSIEIPKGTTTFSIDVSLYNDEELGAFTVPLTWNSPDVTCDSVSFLGGRADYLPISQKLSTVDNPNARMQAGAFVFLMPNIPAGNGLIFKAYFKVAPGAVDQLIKIDSTFFPPAGLFSLTLPSGFNFFPQFNYGTVKYGNPVPIISLSPSSFTFTGLVGGSNPPNQTLNISNTGADVLHWTAAKKSTWLTLNPTSGTGNTAVTLSVSTASLSAGTYYDTITVSDPAAANTPQKAPVTLTVTEPPSVIVLSPTAFAYAVPQGGNLADATLSISNGGGGVLNWTMTNKSAWLALIPSSGSGSADVTLRFSVSSLAMGTYRDTIVVTAPGASNSPRRVPVTIVVQAPPPRIVLDPTSFNYIITEGDALPDDQLSISNGGGGTLNWTIAKTSAWLTLNPTSGSGSGTVTLSFNVSGLAANVYYDTITVSATGASNTPQKVPVTLTVQPPPPTIALAPTSFTYTITEGEPLPDDQLSITNIGGGSLHWTAAHKASWLTLVPTSGTGDATVALRFDVMGLAAGTWYDTITVSDPAATNTPQIATIMLVVEQAPIPFITVSPTSFTFNATEGGANPLSQTLNISNTGLGILNWTVSKKTAWLSLAPLSGTEDGPVTVSVDITGLAPGNYYDTISVADPNAANSPVKVPVTLHIEGLPVIVINPVGFSHMIVEGNSLGDDHLSITNGGGGVLNWTVSKKSAWLTLNPTGGSGNGVVTLSYDVAGLTAGNYYDTITVADPNAVNNPVKAPVTLIVNPPPPVISLNPTLIEFSAVEGDAIPDEQIAVTNIGGGVLNWTASKKSAWLTLNPTGGNGNGIITLSFDITGVAPGTYADTVVVSDPAAVNTPQRTVVKLTVTKAPPSADTVYVETKPAIPGEKVAVDISYVNFIVIRSLSLPLKFDNTLLVCDSVSVVGTRLYPNDEGLVIIDNINGTIYIYGFSMGGPILSPGAGLIARAFFTVDPAAEASFAAIDSAAISPGYFYEFLDSDNNPRKTEFFSGGVDISTTPCFEFPTDTINFQADLGDVMPSISFPVTNTCGGILRWTVTDPADWLMIDPASGVQNEQVMFSIDTAGLVPGSYITTATFESNGLNTPFTVVVTLNLRAKPIIVVDPSMIDLGHVCWGDTVLGSFDITNGGYAVLEWQAGAPAGVVLSDHSGVAPSTVEYTVMTQMLDFGQNILPITITSATAINTPVTLNVKVYVDDCEHCSFDIADGGGGQGGVVAVPIYAYGISNIAGVQFHIGYNPLVATPDSVTSDYLHNPTIGYADNRIHYVWSDIINLVTVPDGGVIATLWLTVTGGMGDKTFLSWTGDNEVVDEYGVPIEGLVYCSGSITVVAPFFDLSGNIVYYDHVKPVPDVDVDLSGAAVASTTTNGDGDYAFSDLAPGAYTVTPSRADNDLGVSIADVLKIRRHLAFVELFDSPYRLIAADVNLTDAVSIADVVVIQRFLAELDILPSGNWAFVDAAFPITMDNWYDAPRSIDAMLSYANLNDLNFIGIRMGDVNNTWPLPVVLVKAPGSGVELTIPNLIGAPSDQIRVPILVGNFSAVGGIEIHIKFDASQLAVDSITAPHLDGVTVNAASGRAHIVWSAFPATVTLADGDSLAFIYFHILPTASGDIALEFMSNCELTDDIGNVYSLTLTNGSLSITPTSADDNQAILPGQFNLKQNYPNPFNPSTTIAYTVDKTMSLTFEVYNVAGQLVDRIDLGRKAPGMHSFVYSGAGLPSGVYTYRLAGDDISMSRQMILVK